MIRFVLRFFGLISLALGFILLVYDGTKSIADQHWHVTRASDVLNLIHESGPGTAGSSGPGAWLWQPLLANILSEPSWLVLLGLGTILILLGRKKRPLIGYAR
jgi:hypothetical protein